MTRVPGAAMRSAIELADSSVSAMNTMNCRCFIASPFPISVGVQDFVIGLAALRNGPETYAP